MEMSVGITNILDPIGPKKKMSTKNTRSKKDCAALELPLT
jgi:hypothetical protein